MNYKKFSDLDSVENLTDGDLFAVSSTKNGDGNFESNKVTFGQIKEQLDYDFDVVEVKEVTPPPEDDDTVYILVNGYRVAATRAKEDIHAVYPTKISRIIPAVPAFRAVKGKLYTIPFTTNNLDLSNLTITADTNNFSLLKVFKIDEQSGYMTVVANLNKSGESSSILTLTDELSGVSASIMVTHARIINGLSNVKSGANKNVITVAWRMELDTNTSYNYSVLEPKFSLSENLKFKVYYDSDYFNQAYLFKEYKYFCDFEARIVLEEFFSGDLVVSFEDFSQGTGGVAYVNVDYQEI